MVIHLADEKVFGHSVCGKKVLANDMSYDSWTFLNSKVTCEECLKIMEVI